MNVFNNSQVRGGTDGQVDHPIVRLPHIQESHYPVTSDAFPSANDPTQSLYTLTRIQHAQANIMEAEWTAMHSGAQTLSRNKVLNALKGANLLLSNLHQSIMSSARLSQSVQVPKSTDGIPLGQFRSGSPEARHPMPSARPFTFSDSVFRVPGHEVIVDQESSGKVAMCLENPDLVFAVPNVPIHSGLSSPRKALVELGFKPIPTTFVLPSFNREGIRPVQGPLLPQIPGKLPGSNGYGDGPIGDKSVNVPTGRLSQSFFGREGMTGMDAKERAACDRLTNFLRNEVAEKGDQGLVRMLQEIRRPC